MLLLFALLERRRSIACESHANRMRVGEKGGDRIGEPPWARGSPQRLGEPGNRIGRLG